MNNLPVYNSRVAIWLDRKSTETGAQMKVWGKPALMSTHVTEAPPTTPELKKIDYCWLL